MASTGDTWQLGRRPALDGLRGVAVLLVVASHALPGWLVAAGSAGVTVFFVLSGFLITSLLLEERASTGRVDLAAFYVRRARRLFPALAAFLAVMLAFGVVSVLQVIPVALYVGNWWPALGLSVGGVGHTWSLAVEEQFYLLFPVLAILALRRSRRLLLALCVAGVAASFVARFALFASDGVDRAYYGTDTNAGALLLGCIVALTFHRAAVPVSRPLLAAVALAMVGVLGFTAEGGPARVLTPVLAALLAAVVIVCVVGDGRVVFLEVRWLRLVGRRSYALYLWHVPLVTILGPTLPGSRWVTFPLVLAASWMLAELSWRYVEAPWMQPSSTSRQPAAARPVVSVAAGRSA